MPEFSKHHGAKIIRDYRFKRYGRRTLGRAVLVAATLTVWSVLIIHLYYGN
jgi:hypothetical protein